MNIDEMTNAELDRALAEIAGEKVGKKWCVYKGERSELLCLYNEKHRDEWWADAIKRDPEYYGKRHLKELPHLPEGWRPTHKYSAQIQNYVIPKLIERDGGLISIIMETTNRNYSNNHMIGERVVYKVSIEKPFEVLARSHTYEKDKINETIARCILKALESLEVSE